MPNDIFTEVICIYIHIMQSAVVEEVERPHTPKSVGSNPSAAVDCLP